MPLNVHGNNDEDGGGDDDDDDIHVRDYGESGASNSTHRTKQKRTKTSRKASCHINPPIL